MTTLFPDTGPEAEQVLINLLRGASVTRKPEMLGRLLLVSFAERPGNILRLISARVATKKERQDYEDNLNS